MGKGSGGEFETGSTVGGAVESSGEVESEGAGRVGSGGAGEIGGEAPARGCTSCGKLPLRYVAFLCPSCLGQEIVRCLSCRINENHYTCQKCGFEGP